MTVCTKTWTTSSQDVQLTEQDKADLWDAVNKLKEAEDKRHVLFKMRANASFAVLRLDRMRAICPWHEDAWKAMVDAGTWKVVGHEEDDEFGELVFVHLQGPLS